MISRDQLKQLLAALRRDQTAPPVLIRLAPSGTLLPMWTPARVPAPCGGEG
ncbi:hypothetical protein LI90_818 [Carbonactinospora thermoautotrophica]|uniref:Uncharacterized protein n=1 Tax=Carbonactinospora thermoautotrophica TaxID=1469144 RepID=A0A132MMV1_9ACTN|nr:hypothetical protein [Carbonactinospora thermoautotrophica]KWW99184.1 hypothetical protein LI90_818 [Carbonactinospora thermoautotrophica]